MAEANTVATPYTTNQGVSQDQLRGMQSSISQGYKDIPAFREQLAGRISAEEGMLKPLQESKAGLIQQLFDYDRNYSNTYGTAGTAGQPSQTFIENPLARSRGMSQMTAPMWGGISSLTQDIATRRSLLGDTISRAVEARKLELQAQEAELANMWKLFENQQAQQAKENEIVDYRDLGDRIVGVNAYGREIASFAKKQTGTGGTGLEGFDIFKDKDKTGTTDTKGASTTKNQSSYTLSEAEAFKTSNKSTTDLQKRQSQLQNKANKQVFLSDQETKEMFDIQNELAKRKKSGSSSLNLKGVTMTQPKTQSSGLKVGSSSVNSGLNGLGLQLDANGNLVLK